MRQDLSNQVLRIEQVMNTIHDASIEQFGTDNDVAKLASQGVMLVTGLLYDVLQEDTSDGT